MTENILESRNLHLYYATRKGPVMAVDNISFNLRKGESLALVGESGCGKSSLAKAIIRLLPRNILTYEGEVLLQGEDIMKLGEKQFRQEVRWKKISMVFQGAMNSLNPVLKVGYQVAEPLLIHENLSKKDAKERSIEALSMVGIHESFVERYPFELSGGMKQRTVIAMALITNPQILILDEPTSALDVITQANIMNLLKKLKKEMGLSYIFITHDIGLSSELADKIAVMYAGEIQEIADAETFYREPAHPYSQKLMASVPTLRTEKKPEFIPGAPPSLINPPTGCRFHPRCHSAFDKCTKESPEVFDLGSGHRVKCWWYEGPGEGNE
ncbi:MAG: ABC transporter ATP-binding protein [Candidatus Bathyarchaeota archaeon]|nr:ABC transporter ATP-binding protein [Candidatus Bathyarchaeota archaeon]